jgi:ATP-binding cassette subfamily C (CFTR/MRP) protein 1
VSAFAVLQLTVLLIWATSPSSGSKATIPAASLDFVAACILCLLSAYEHTRTVAPSSIIGLYLLISLPFDIARLRTLFLLETLTTRSVATILTLSTLVKVGVIVIEAANKRKILLARYQGLPPEATSGIYSRSVFWWVNGLLHAGFLHILQVEDLHAVDETLRSTNVSVKFHRTWSRAKKSREYALIAATWSALKWSLIVSGIPRLLLIGIKYAQPFLIQRTINYVADRENQPSNVGWGLVGAYAIIYVGQALLTAAYNHLLNRCIVQIRGGLVSLIYSKTIDLSITALDESAALTLMSTDVQTIADSLIWLHDSWGSAIEVGIAVYLLYRVLGAATVAPGMVFLCAMIAMGALTRIFPRLQKAWIQAIQIRVSFTATMLGSMRSIKLLGISNVVRELTQGLRRQEIAVSTHLRKASILRVIMQNSTSIFAPFVTFAVFVAQANKTGQPLNTATAFNVLSILQLMESPISQLVRTLPILVASVSCFARIQDFLLSRSRQDHRMTIGRTSRNSFYQASSAQSEEGIEMTSNVSVSHMLTDDAMVLQSCSFGWSSNKIVLHDVDLRFKTSSITMVIGPVGCGKSTLIKGMLGETPSSAGFVYTSTSSIAFADQEPWSRNSTIRESIRAESNHDELFYEEVVDSCGLIQDLYNLPNGDSTIIGSKGISLSGGQKQRLALARAVYARKDILMLDDVFSGLDADTEEHIFRKLFSKTGLLRRNKTTVVLVTHAVHRLPYADHIVALGADGRIFEQGKYDSLRQSGGYVQGLAIRHKGSSVATNEEDPATGAEPARRPPLPNDGIDEAADLSRKTGDWQTYKQYFAAAGWWASISSILWCLVALLALKSPGLLITFFTGDAATGSSSNTVFLIVFGILSLIATLSLLATCGTVFLRLVSLLFLHALFRSGVMSRAPSKGHPL